MVESWLLAGGGNRHLRDADLGHQQPWASARGDDRSWVL